MRGRHRRNSRDLSALVLGSKLELGPFHPEQLSRAHEICRAAAVSADAGQGEFDGFRTRER
jgi:hypothetical protein